MSSGPPGGNGTTRCTGFEGKSCAVALVASANIHRRTAVVRLMIPPRRKTIRASPPGKSAGAIIARSADFRGRYEPGLVHSAAEQVLDREPHAPLARHPHVPRSREIAALLRGIPRAGSGAPRAAGDDAAPENGD